MKFIIGQKVMYHKKGKQIKEVEVINIKKKYLQEINKKSNNIKKRFFEGFRLLIDCIFCNQLDSIYVHIYEVIDKDYNKYEAKGDELMPIYKKTQLII